MIVAYKLVQYAMMRESDPDNDYDDRYELFDAADVSSD